MFAKYDLPERKVADSLLDFYHEKGELYKQFLPSSLPFADLLPFIALSLQSILVSSPPLGPISHQISTR